MNNYSNRYGRRFTIVIDCHDLGFKPPTLIIHQLIFEQFHLAPEEVECIEFCPYKRSLFLRLANQTIVDRVLEVSRGIFLYRDGGLQVQLEVKLDQGSKISALVYSVPFDVSNADLAQCLQIFGPIYKIIALKYDQQHVYQTLSGKRLVIFDKLLQPLPKYKYIYGYPIQIRSDTQQQEVPRTAESERQPPYNLNSPTHRQEPLSMEAFPLLTHARVKLGSEQHILQADGNSDGATENLTGDEPTEDTTNATSIQSDPKIAEVIQLDEGDRTADGKPQESEIEESNNIFEPKIILTEYFESTKVLPTSETDSDVEGESISEDNKASETTHKKRLASATYQNNSSGVVKKGKTGKIADLRRWPDSSLKTKYQPGNIT